MRKLIWPSISFLKMVTFARGQFYSTKKGIFKLITESYKNLCYLNKTRKNVVIDLYEGINQN